MSVVGSNAEVRSPDVMSALPRTAHIVRRDRQVGKVRSPEGPPCRARRKPGISTPRVERLGLLICPLSSLISDFPKNISVPTHPKSDLELWPSHPTRGAYHDRHGRGEGCGGRGSVLRATGSQGGFFESVSGQQRADERCCSVRRSRVVLTPRRWRQVRGVKSAQPGLDKTYPLTTVANKPDHRGEREGNR
jgi:hypothetical protein